MDKFLSEMTVWDIVLIVSLIVNLHNTGRGLAMLYEEVQDFGWEEDTWKILMLVFLSFVLAITCIYLLNQ